MLSPLSNATRDSLERCQMKVDSWNVTLGRSYQPCRLNHLFTLYSALLGFYFLFKFFPQCFSTFLHCFFLLSPLCLFFLQMFVKSPGSYQLRSGSIIFSPMLLLNYHPYSPQPPPTLPAWPVYACIESLCHLKS